MALTPPALLEALLFAAGEPLSKKRLATLIGVTPETLTKAVEVLRTELNGRGLAVIETEDEVELRTAADAAEYVKKLREAELSRDLGKAGLETLAIILYKGSATRSEIDWVRGVNSTAALRGLMLRGLIERIEDATDRRRMRYKPSIDALAHLGVSTGSELPRYAELTSELAKREVVETES